MVHRFFKEHGLIINSANLQRALSSFTYLFVTVLYGYKKIMYDLAMKMQ